LRIVYLANGSRSIDYMAVFQLLVNDVVKSGALDVVFLMYKVTKRHSSPTSAPRHVLLSRIPAFAA
jgi:hypothetical protein